MKRDRDAHAADPTNRPGNWGGFSSYTARGGGANGKGAISGVDAPSTLKLCLLLRLGRADLAENLFAAGTASTPDAPTGPDFDELGLALDWAAGVFIHLADAHMRGDDAIALDTARRLSAFARAFETRAAHLGFARARPRAGEAPSYLPFLRQLPELLADHERRARDPARGPMPRRGADPSARIAALIRDLDRIQERQMKPPGRAYLGSSPFVKALIAEGDVAVEPLLTALETDMRLTRTVSYGRGMSIDRYFHPVYEAEFAALTGLLATSEFAHADPRLRGSDLVARKELARSMRDFWIKNRAISLNERWYRMLRDDAAGPERWTEAALGIVRPKAPTGSSAAIMAFGAYRMLRPETSPMVGEALRSRRDPSVSELLARRATQLAASPAGFDVHHRAGTMAMILDRWDEKAALPVIRTTMARCLEQIELNREQNSGVNVDEVLVTHMAAFTLIRMAAGDRLALEEYAAWARKTSPAELKYRTIACFEPMWRFPNDPSIREASRLFHDPRSPWVPLLRNPGNHSGLLFDHSRLYASPMVATAGFRMGLIDAMAIKTRMGTVRRDRGLALLYRTTDRWEEGFVCRQEDADSLEPGMERPFRVCDYLAWQVSSIEGAPRCELYWPEDRRDRAVQACAAFLKRYRERFTGDPLVGKFEFPDERRAHLAFPIATRPATLDDVRAARAIFSLEGQGEVRLAKVPALPIRARWITLEDSPVHVRQADGTIARGFDQDGWIWQAEEVRNGDRWEHYYGFVGPHVVARVPAAEVELAADRFMWGPLPCGLDARIEPADPSIEGYEPGRPVVMIVRIRNRRGVENASPTGLLRRGADGRPSLRRGVSLAVFSSDPTPSRAGAVPVRSEQELKPTRTDRSQPGADARPLSAFEEFEAMRLDLNDWFDLKRPGSYRVRVAFAADSGLGEGATNDRHFTVVDPGGPLP